MSISHRCPICNGVCGKKTGPKPLSIQQRIERLIEKDENGCWNWKGSISNHGYGVIRTGYLYLGTRNEIKVAHRVSYETYVGPIPDGLVIDHLCCNRACVNPAHLEAVTIQENSRRAYHRRGLMPFTKLK